MVRGLPEDYLDPGPADIACVIEIADRSLRNDRTTKQAIYAAAGIRQFVIVNLVEGRTEVYEEPNVAERCYGVVRVLRRGDRVPLPLHGGEKQDVPTEDWLPR